MKVTKIMIAEEFRKFKKNAITLNSDVSSLTKDEFLFLALKCANEYAESEIEYEERTMEEVFHGDPPQLYDSMDMYMDDDDYIGQTN